MKNYIAAQRYAQALDGAISDALELEAALKWLQNFSALLAENRMLDSVLRNPAIRAEARLGVLDDVLAKTDAPAKLRNLLRELFRRGRLDIVEEIAEAFGRFVDRRLNRLTARVTTARPLNEQDAENIRAGLAAYLNKEVRLRTRINPDVIGGVVVRVDGTIIDGSLRARLKQLRNALLSQENGTL